MPVVEKLICKEKDGTLSFGNYLLQEKKKLENFKYEGDLYKIKTYYEITKLEKNGMFVYESVPGTSVNHMKVTENGMDFSVEGKEDAQITLELEPEKEYKVTIDENESSVVKTNMSGKLNLSVEFNEGQAVSLKVELV